MGWSEAGLFGRPRPGVEEERGAGVSRAPASQPWNLSWTLTTQAKPFQTSTLQPGQPVAGERAVEIDLGAPLQRIDGFGGAFNEKGWEALRLLPAAQRDRALAALFDPENGARLDFCRVPIGASDYALERYTLDESQDDFGMTHFSIERDRQALIPYIREAMKFQPRLRLWGSAWTPPTWMKDSGRFDGGAMKDQAEVYDAYALYLARFVEAYQAEGLPVSAVAVQNEPFVETGYPSCRWQPAQFNTFIKSHLGPLFAKRKVNAEIWLATLQDGDYDTFPRAVLDDPQARRYVSAVGLQWNGLAALAAIRALHPDLPIVQTETECGNNPWEAGFKPDKAPNDWGYAVFTWRKLKAFLGGGASRYMLWNLVLDEVGTNLDQGKPWPQNAPLVVNRQTSQLVLTPMYYAFLHVSGFVDPGARLLPTAGGWKDAMAFRNPDGAVLVMLQNDTGNPQPIALELGGEPVRLTLPARSFATVQLTPKNST